jgi:ribosomal protein L37E
LIGGRAVSLLAHPYANQRIGLATMHAKELAVAPPFRRVLGAEIVAATQLDTDTLGTFSGEVPRPDALVETCALKAELAFRSLDVDCAMANEGSYGPIDAVPFVPSGIEIMAFLDRKRGIRIIETISTHRTNWRLLRFKAGDPNIPKAVKAIGFPRYGVFVLCSSDMDHPIKTGLDTLDDVVSAMDQEANRSEDGLAVLIADMRAHRNPTRMRVLRALSWKLAKRLECLCPKCHAPGFGSIGNRRGLSCEDCGEPTHWVQFEIDGCSVCGYAESRPRKDGRTTAARLSCGSCNPKA